MKLDLRFIVPGPAAGDVLLDAADGCLPARGRDGDRGRGHGRARSSAFLRDAWQLDAAVLETHPKWDERARPASRSRRSSRPSRRAARLDAARRARVRAAPG